MFALASTAHAQAPLPDPSAARVQPTPKPPRFTGTATAGISLESGRTDLNGVQVAFTGARPNTGTTAVAVSLSYAFATTIAPGESKRVTVANRLTTSFDVSQDVRKHLVAMFRVQALRDPVAQLKYRFGEMTGFGVRLDTKRVKVRLVPGVALFSDDKNIAAEKGFHFHYGIYQDVTAAIAPAWTFTEYVSASKALHPRDYILDINAKLTGAITKHVGIQLSYQFNYESRQPPGVDPEYQKTVAGVQIKF